MKANMQAVNRSKIGITLTLKKGRFFRPYWTMLIFTTPYVKKITNKEAITRFPYLQYISAKTLFPGNF